ncbi:pentraxin-4-like [Carlito syrichta]|uniref:Pentraxin-4-like n=1 Tax=Carlito syrichta TaxID=1868482 RepID=A0A1U7UEG3_CARSF|nr:pentraxin-4-like [Carlito syrichta]
MGCLGRKTLPLFLIFVSIYLHGVLLQKAALTGPRRPYFERLHRLEEQIRRFQEMTLTHLQNIARHFNMSYDMDYQFQSLVKENQAMALAINRSQAAMQGQLADLKTWMRKTQHRSRKVEARLQSLDLALSEKSKQQAQESKIGQEALWDTLNRLTHLAHSQATRLATLEQQLQITKLGTTAVGPTMAPATTLAQSDWPSPRCLMHQGGGQVLRAPAEHRSPSQDTACACLQGTQEATAPRGQERGEIGIGGPVLIFPNASIENVVFLSPSFLTTLRALSICSWVRTDSGRLGTLLSYATEDNDNKLVLHGWDSMSPGSVHFVIGDPDFRVLPLYPLLDNRWHHICVIWMSVQGRYWLYVDRRLLATGSHFREGYEIPPGGSLVLGQEQDSVGGGFDSSEAFVGRVSGLAIWDRALVPGEVADLATGKSLPTGAILTLANATLAGGFVQRTYCLCLECCP